MTAGVLCIGTEITRGEIVNTNANWLADRLTEEGFEVTEIVSVADDRPRLVDTLRQMAAEHDVVACTGGLGPTSDDLTTACAAMAAGRPLVRDEASVEAIRDRFRRMGRTMMASNVKQADFPAGATVMPNAVGTAPGFWMSVGRARVFFFPGVPRELHHLWDVHAHPVLCELRPERAYQLRLRTFGDAESAIAQRLEDIEARFPGIIVGYRASFPEIEVKLLGKGAAAQGQVEAAARAVRSRLGALVYGEGKTSFVSVVADSLRARGYRLALAESCTGGLLAHLLTGESASDYLVAGMVTYANEAKTRLLGVPEEMLERHGAVSEPVARAMAEGAARSQGVEVGVGITGIAGPTGGTADKPLGLVHYAVAYPGGVVARHRVFPGDRALVQRFAAFAAMHLIRTCCSDSPPS